MPEDMGSPLVVSLVSLFLAFIARELRLVLLRNSDASAEPVTQASCNAVTGSIKSSLQEIQETVDRIKVSVDTTLQMHMLGPNGVQSWKGVDNVLRTLQNEVCPALRRIEDKLKK